MGNNVSVTQGKLSAISREPRVQPAAHGDADWNRPPRDGGIQSVESGQLRVSSAGGLRGSQRDDSRHTAIRQPGLAAQLSPVGDLQSHLLLIDADVVGAVRADEGHAALSGDLLLQAYRPVTGVDHHAAETFILEIAGVSHGGSRRYAPAFPTRRCRSSPRRSASCAWMVRRSASGVIPFRTWPISSGLLSPVKVVIS